MDEPFNCYVLYILPIYFQDFGTIYKPLKYAKYE